MVWFLSKSSTMCAEEIPTEFLIRKLLVMRGYFGHLGDSLMCSLIASLTYHKTALEES